MTPHLCECGCGLETKRSHGGRASTVKSGEYFRFIAGHYRRVDQVTRFYRKREGRLVHVARAERALGKPLPPKAVVHHADGTRDPNGPLVICQNQAYHRLLHMRMRIKAFGGNPNTDRVCVYCHQAKPIDDFVRITRPENTWHCRECSRANNRRARQSKLRASAAMTDQGA